MTAPAQAPTHEHRDCIDAFATGVTVVTVADAGGLAGTTLSSFTSVSLDPLLVLVALAHGTRTLELVRRCGRLTISILHRGQRDVARAFAADGATAPAELVDRPAHGYAQVRDALAALRCSVAVHFPAGDHDVVVCAVEHFERRAGAPLVLHRGAFHDFEPATPEGKATT